MKLFEAIKRADALRPNEIDSADKAAWLFELEGEVAELIGADVPESSFPEDAELLMPYPHDNIYELYLAARIDLYHGEGALYENDRTVAQTAYNSAAAWWRRGHRPQPSENWRTMT